MLKNYKLKAFALLLLAGSVLGSCDYLDIAPAEIMTEDKIFQDITLAQQDLGSMYHDIIKWTALNSDDRLLRDGPFTWTGCRPACRTRWCGRASGTGPDTSSA